MHNKNSQGGYKSLAIFKQAEIIYDFKSRTKDQMEQASRSGKQNIAEAYLQKRAEGLEELLNDYLDFLRQKRLSAWDKNSPQSRNVRSLVYKPDLRDYLSYLDSPESAANTMVCLINQTNQLLDQKLRWTEEKFVKEGGFRENLLKKRLVYRQQNE